MSSVSVLTTSSSVVNEIKYRLGTFRIRIDEFISIHPLNRREIPSWTDQLVQGFVAPRDGVPGEPDRWLSALHLLVEDNQLWTDPPVSKDEVPVSWAPSIKYLCFSGQHRIAAIKKLYPDVNDSRRWWSAIIYTRDLETVNPVEFQARILSLNETLYRPQPPSAGNSWIVARAIESDPAIKPEHRAVLQARISDWAKNGHFYRNFVRHSLLAAAMEKAMQLPVVCDSYNPGSWSRLTYPRLYRILAAILDEAVAQLSQFSNDIQTLTLKALCGPKPRKSTFYAFENLIKMAEGSGGEIWKSSSGLQVLQNIQKGPGNFSSILVSPDKRSWTFPKYLLVPSFFASKTVIEALESTKLIIHRLIGIVAGDKPLEPLTAHPPRVMAEPDHPEGVLCIILRRVRPHLEPGEVSATGIKILTHAFHHRNELAGHLSNESQTIIGDIKSWWDLAAGFGIPPGQEFGSYIHFIMPQDPSKPPSCTQEPFLITSGSHPPAPSPFQLSENSIANTDPLRSVSIPPLESAPTPPTSPNLSSANTSVITTAPSQPQLSENSIPNDSLRRGSMPSPELVTAATSPGLLSANASVKPTAPSQPQLSDNSIPPTSLLRSASVPSSESAPPVATSPDLSAENDSIRTTAPIQLLTPRPASTPPNSRPDRESQLSLNQISPSGPPGRRLRRQPKPIPDMPKQMSSAPRRSKSVRKEHSTFQYTVQDITRVLKSCDPDQLEPLKTIIDRLLCDDVSDLNSLAASVDHWVQEHIPSTNSKKQRRRLRSTAKSSSASESDLPTAKRRKIEFQLDSGSELTDDPAGSGPESQSQLVDDDEPPSNISIDEESMRKRYEEALIAVSQCKNAVFITGAGISVAAGIPDFRSRDGVFADFGARLLDASAHNDVALKRQYDEWLLELFDQLEKVDSVPNTHQLLSKLGQLDRLVHCYTQNIDNLEARAGLTGEWLPGATIDDWWMRRHAHGPVVQLHGSIGAVVCSRCRRLYTTTRERLKAISDLAPLVCPYNCGDTRTHGVLSEVDIVRYQGGQVKELNGLVKSGKKADSLFILGTSLEVKNVQVLAEFYSSQVKHVFFINREPRRAFYDIAKAAKSTAVFVEADVEQWAADALARLS